MKNISLALLLSVAMLTECFMYTAAAVTYSDIPSYDAEFAVDFLQKLEIVDYLENDVFNSNDYVTRGDFAVQVTKIMGVYSESEASTTFSDIRSDNIVASAVNTLAALKIISGDSEIFRPGDPITYTESIKMLVSALGYDHVAQRDGGYPYGYLAVAGQIDVVPGDSSYGANEPVTKLDAAIMIFNALLATKNSGTSFELGDTSVDVKNYTQSGTFLYSTYGIDFHEGILYGHNNSYLLSDKTVRNGYVDIGGELYIVGDVDVDDYIGYSVKAYFKTERSIKTLFAIDIQPNYNNIIEIDAQDVILSSVTDSQMEYIANDKTKRLTLSIDNVMYNGRAYLDWISLKDVLDIKTGFIRLIGYGGNRPSVLIVREYVDGLVERIDSYNDKIYMKNLSKPIALDYANTDSYISIKYGDQQLSLSDLQKGDALSFCQSKDGLYILVKVSRKSVVGEISEVDDTNKSIVISGVEYKISPYNIDRLALGDNGTYALTDDGKIIGYTKILGGDNGYGYVLEAAVDGGGLVAPTDLKIFGQDGVMRIVQTASSVRMNGKKVKGSEVAAHFTNPQLVTYIINSDGKIVEINKPIDATSNPDFLDEGSFVYNKQGSSLRYVGGILSRYLVTDDTVIFYLPLIDRDRDSDYRVMTKKDLKQGSQYDASFYDVNRESKIGALVIKVSISDSVDFKSSLFVVNYMSRAMDLEGDLCYKAYGFEDGQPKEILFSNEAVSVPDEWVGKDNKTEQDKDVEQLRCGDIIQYSTDVNDEVIAYRLVFNTDKIYSNGQVNLSSDKFFEQYNKAGKPKANEFYADLYIAFGRVIRRNISHMVILGLNTADELGYTTSNIIDGFYRAVGLDQAFVYEYDLSKDEIKIIDQGAIDEEDIVVVRATNAGEIVDVLVYRK